MIQQLSYIKRLHKRVIHEEMARASLRTANAEDRYIKKTDYNELNLICKECFSSPTY